MAGAHGTRTFWARRPGPRTDYVRAARPLTGSASLSLGLRWGMRANSAFSREDHACAVPVTCSHPPVTGIDRPLERVRFPEKSQQALQLALPGSKLVPGGPLGLMVEGGRFF